MGIGSVGVYSEADRDAPHVARPTRRTCSARRCPPRAICDVERLSRRPSEAGAQAIHPGYGFLAENAGFARRLRGGRDHVHRPAGERDRGDGLEDPGPRADGGGRRADRARHDRAGRDVADAAKDGEEIGYPVACKAAGGGGGKGFRVAAPEDELEDAFEGAAREGEKFFSDPTRLPRALPRGPAPRRGAGAGRLARQRDPPRRAGLLDPAPPPEADRGGARAARSTRRCASGSARSPPTPRRPSTTARRRHGRGRCQDGDGVLLPGDEHPRPGRALRDRDGHRDRHRPRADPRSRPASRCRWPRRRSSSAGTRSSAGSTPRPPTRTSPRRPGRIDDATRSPPGPGVRVDSGVAPGSEVTPLYDPMIAKLIVWDIDRERATARMLRALGEYEIGGLTTLIPFHQAILRAPSSGRRRDLPGPDRGPQWLKTLAPAAARAETGERGRGGRRPSSAATRSRSTARFRSR